ncbi:N-acetylglucosamine-6-sulfatase [Anabrus simplex]|uniref:N-acetylglucosamine-6-sulfatase n=1 Tax=Anabrus simplex TaxID=316456 RepID=UPI0035A395C7
MTRLVLKNFILFVGKLALIWKLCLLKRNRTTLESLFLTNIMAFLIITLACYLLHFTEGQMSDSNIVLFLTDDQDLVLGGLTPMVKTQKLIADVGATFTNAFVTTPICCPSRSSILTGLYLHNHGTVNNSVDGGCSSPSWQQKHETQTFAAHLHENGYTTFYAGKYLNQYGKHGAGGPEHVPPGWDWWIGLVGNSRYYNYTLSVNGTARRYSSDYLTDVIRDYSLDFLRQKRVMKGKFLMVLATPAPHAPFTPVPKYLNRFKNVKAMRTPNFNIPGHMEKHWLLRMKPSPLPDSMLPTLDSIYHHRWETLLSVDDLVEAVIKQLNSMELLSNTFVIFTSDHGYHIGQFGLPWDKRQPYESDIRVPLLIRGPHIPSKMLISQPVLNIDLAPTFIAMAGLLPIENMDGKSFLDLLISKPEYTGRIFLVEYRGEGDDESVASECVLPLDNNLAECVPEACCKCQDSRNNTFVCIRHLAPNDNYIYCRFDDSEDFKELYNLEMDPYQLQNIAYLLDENSTNSYNELLSQMSTCHGKTCRIG